MTPYKTKQKQKQKQKYEVNLNKYILIKLDKNDITTFTTEQFQFCKNMLQTYCNSIGLGLDGFN